MTVYGNGEPTPYDQGLRDGWRARAAAAAVVGLPSDVPLECCGGVTSLDYEQLTPWGMMPAAMEIHRVTCPGPVSR